MADVVFTDGVILTAESLNAAMQQKADVLDPQFQGTMAIPQGPTAQRPSMPAPFAFRGNTDSGLPEVFIAGAWVSVSLTSPGNAPSPPSPLTIGTVSSSAVPLTWGASTGSGTIKYQVQYQIGGASSWSNWGGPSTALSATISGLQANTKYNFQVISSNQYGSSVSATVSTQTLGIAPDAPTNLVLGSITSQSMALSWDGSSVGSQPISYQVALQKSGDSSFTPFGSAVSGTSEVITGLAPLTGYAFQVTALNNGGSAVSTSVSGTTLAPAGVAPNAPTGLTPSAIGQNSLTLSWVASSAGSAPINYTVFVSTSGSAYVSIGAPITSTSIGVSGLNPSTTYSFYVVASNSAGSAQSNSATATTSAVTPGTTGQVWGTQYSGLAAPILQGPVAGQVALSQALAIKGLAVSDPPAANNPGNCSLTIACNKNAGTVSSTDASGSPVAGSGTGTINGYLGSLSSISTVLQNLVYTAPAIAASDIITVQFSDQSANKAQISIKVAAVQGAAPSLPWGKSSLTGPGNISTDASGTVAIRVQDILGNLGVNTHIDKNPSPYFNNLSQIENAINYLGLTILKDYPDPNQPSDTTWFPQIKNNVQVVGGLKYWLQILNGATAGFQPQLDLFVKMAASGYVVAFQGEGGADFAPGGVADAETFQKTIFNAAQTSKVKTGTFTVSPSVVPSSIPSQASVSDYGTVGFLPVDAPFDSGFTQYLTTANTITPGKPAIIEGFGWQSFAEGGSAVGQQNNASVNAVAAYALNTIFDAVMLGFTGFFWENLVDDPNDYTGSTTYGLFDSSWNPKPAGTAIRNMNLLLMDQASNANTFAPGKLGFSTDVALAGIDQLGLHAMVLQRADGAFFLALWNEQILQDLANYPNQTNAEITVAPINVALTLTTAATNIAVYDPMVGTTAVQTGSGTSITVSVPAHVIFVEIVRP